MVQKHGFHPGPSAVQVQVQYSTVQVQVQQPAIGFIFATRVKVASRVIGLGWGGVVMSFELQRMMYTVHCTVVHCGGKLSGISDVSEIR